MHYGYAASLGITRSANRKNRWLRAPATNDPGGLRSPTARPPNKARRAVAIRSKAQQRSTMAAQHDRQFAALGINSIAPTSERTTCAASARVSSRPRASLSHSMRVR